MDILLPDSYNGIVVNLLHSESCHCLLYRISFGPAVHVIIPLLMVFS